VSNHNQLPESLTSPLTAAHYDTLQVASRQYHDLLHEFDRAESCGIPCQQMRSDALAHKAQIDAILREYFPHGRPQ